VGSVLRWESGSNPTAAEIGLWGTVSLRSTSEQRSSDRSHSLHRLVVAPALSHAGDLEMVQPTTAERGRGRGRGGGRGGRGGRGGFRGRGGGGGQHDDGRDDKHQQQRHTASSNSKNDSDGTVSRVPFSHQLRVGEGITWYSLVDEPEMPEVQPEQPKLPVEQADGAKPKRQRHKHKKQTAAVDSSAPKRDDPFSPEKVLQLFERAKKMHSELGVNRSLSSKPRSDEQWLRTVSQSGTLVDKIAAATVIVREDPVFQLSALDNLINAAKKRGGGEGGRRASVVAINTLVELFTGDHLLPNDRRLRYIQTPSLSQSTIPTPHTHAHMHTLSYRYWYLSFIYSTVCIIDFLSD